MGLSKTKNLLEYINNPNFEIYCIIAFRTTLANEYKRIMPDFELYSGVKEKNIDLGKHKKLIIQVDYLYGTRRIADVLILDGFRYTDDHIVTGIKHFKERCIYVFNVLMNSSKKVIALDASLNEDCLYLIKLYRNNIYYDVNIYRKHADKKVYVYSNDPHKFVNNIVNTLKNGEKIVIASNSKTKLKVFENKINDIFNNKTKTLWKVYPESE
jgi:hypothetical protein